ncbi:hypothetical protein PR048_031809 [Dryococelus australis]|uniref:Reverse transcriptase domain-containing protein n=1 Tax=Dryococelus australis TaxID=614101 RepID=A0ABQ9G6B7_9NEOP|nr:hypothetical protein PR048_031809 [Dryococelus australis]
MKQQPFMVGMAFIVNRSYLASINEWKGKDSESTEHFWNMLDRVLTEADKRGVTILLGDFNTQNGERLVDLCRRHKMRIMTMHYKAKASKKTMWVSPGIRIGERQLDHIAIRDRKHREIMNARVWKNSRMESEHYLTEIKCRWIPNRTKKNKFPNIHRIDRDLLYKHKDEYMKNLTVESIRDNLRDVIKEQSKQLVKGNVWMKWQASKNPEDLSNFEIARRMAAKVIRNARRNRWDERLEDADEAFKKNKSQAFLREMKSRIKGYEAREHFVKGRDGGLKICEKDVCEEMARAEVVKAIKDIKANKVAGNEGICNEEIKWGGLVTEDSIYRIIADTCMNRKIHIDWKEAIIIPIHNKGDKNILDNYRGISLLNIRYKILSKLLLYRMEEQFGSSIGENQGDFRKGRNCMKEKTTIETFEDFKKAYDSIDRNTLLDVLRDRGMDTATHQLVKETLESTTARTGVRQGDGLSRILFNLVLDEVVKQWRQLNKAMGIEDVQIGYKIKHNVIDANMAVANLAEIAAKVGLKIAYSKTKVLNAKTDWKIEGQVVKRVDSFRYLPVAGSGGCGRKYTARAMIATIARRPGQSTLPISGHRSERHDHANRVRFPAVWLPRILHAGIAPDDAAGRGFSGGSPVSPTALTFRRYYMLTSFNPHRLSTPRPPLAAITAATLSDMLECLHDIHGDSSPFLLQPFHELSNGFWPRLTSPHPVIQFVPKMFCRVEVGAVGGPVQSANIVVDAATHHDVHFTRMYIVPQNSHRWPLRMPLNVGITNGNTIGRKILYNFSCERCRVATANYSYATAHNAYDELHRVDGEGSPRSRPCLQLLLVSRLSFQFRIVQETACFIQCYDSVEKRFIVVSTTDQHTVLYSRHPTQFHGTFHVADPYCCSVWARSLCPNVVNSSCRQAVDQYAHHPPNCLSRKSLRSCHLRPGFVMHGRIGNQKLNSDKDLSPGLKHNTATYDIVTAHVFHLKHLARGFAQLLAELDVCLMLKLRHTRVRLLALNCPSQQYCPWCNLSTVVHHSDTMRPVRELTDHRSERRQLRLLYRAYNSKEQTSGAGMRGEGKREIPEKTRGQTASSGTIPTCENPVTRPGIEAGSPWWEASVLTAQPPCNSMDSGQLPGRTTIVSEGLGSGYKLLERAVLSCSPGGPVSRSTLSQTLGCKTRDQFYLENETTSLGSLMPDRRIRDPESRNFVGAKLLHWNQDQTGSYFGTRIIRSRIGEDFGATGHTDYCVCGWMDGWMEDIVYQRTAQARVELLARIMHAATEIKSRVQLRRATRLRENPASIPAPYILNSFFHGFPKSRHANVKMVPYCDKTRVVIDTASNCATCKTRKIRPCGVQDVDMLNKLVTCRFTSLGRYSLSAGEVQALVLPVEDACKDSMKSATEEAVTQNNNDRDLTFALDESANYKGTSGSMEVSGTVNISNRSIPQYNVRYINYLGDGDCKGHKAVLQTASYGDKSVKIKLLRTCTEEDGNEKEGERERDRVCVCVWAENFHFLSSDEDPQNGLCPKSAESWCKYQQAKTKGECYEHADHFHLPRVVVEEMKPIFRDVSEPELLKKCLHGSTQNPNESVNSVIWNRLSKTTFIGVRTLHFGVWDDVASFNEGNLVMWHVYERLDFPPGRNCVQAMKRLDGYRLDEAKRVVKNIGMKARQNRKAAKRKLEDLYEQQEDPDEPSYGAGIGIATGRVDATPRRQRETMLQLSGHEASRRGGNDVEWSSAGIQGLEKRDIPEKTHRSGVSSSTIPTCENPCVTQPGIGPGSHRLGGEQFNRSASATPGWKDTHILPLLFPPSGSTGTQGRGKQEIPEKTQDISILKNILVVTAGRSETKFIQNGSDAVAHALAHVIVHSFPLTPPPSLLWDYWRFEDLFLAGVMGWSVVRVRALTTVARGGTGFDSRRGSFGCWRQSEEWRSTHVVPLAAGSQQMVLEKEGRGSRAEPSGCNARGTGCYMKVCLFLFLPKGPFQVEWNKCAPCSGVDNVRPTTSERLPTRQLWVQGPFYESDLCRTTRSYDSRTARKSQPKSADFKPAVFNVTNTIRYTELCRSYNKHCCQHCSLQSGRLTKSSICIKRSIVREDDMTYKSDD